MEDLNTSDYEFVWTANGVHWAGRFFDSLDELRDFAGDLVSANEENPAFKFYGRRFEVMDACDMLDRGIRPERVRLTRFEEGDEGAEPVLSGKRRDFVAERLIHLIRLIEDVYKRQVRTVSGVASTPTLRVRVELMAARAPGAITPITGTGRICCAMRRPAAVAVLQAITMILMSRSASQRPAWRTNERTSSSERTPYGQRLVSPT